MKITSISTKSLLKDPTSGFFLSNNKVDCCYVGTYKEIQDLLGPKKDVLKIFRKGGKMLIVFFIKEKISMIEVIRPRNQLAIDMGRTRDNVSTLTYYFGGNTKSYLRLPWKFREKPIGSTQKYLTSDFFSHWIKVRQEKMSDYKEVQYQEAMLTIDMWI